MSRQDLDLAAVRELPPGVPEPTEESVARTWHQITARNARQPVRPWARLLVPVMAAAVVAGLAVGGAVVFRSGEAPLGFGSPGGSKTSDVNRAPASPEAVAALNALATAASTQTAATLQPGELIQVDHRGWAANIDPNGASGTLEPQAGRMLFDPNGMTMVTDGSVPSAKGGPNEPSREPSFAFPTPEWLAALPTDPDQLRERLRGEMGDEDAWSTDHQVWSTMQEFYLRTDLLLGPELRAGLLRAFTGLRGLTTTDVTIDGRELVAIRHTERLSGDEILFDPTTGLAVGRRSISLDPNLVVAPPEGGPTLDQGVISQSTWTQRLTPR